MNGKNKDVLDAFLKKNKNDDSYVQFKSDIIFNACKQDSTSIVVNSLVVTFH